MWDRQPSLTHSLALVTWPPVDGSGHVADADPIYLFDAHFEDHAPELLEDYRSGWLIVGVCVSICLSACLSVSLSVCLSPTRCWLASKLPAAPLSKVLLTRAPADRNTRVPKYFPERDGHSRSGSDFRWFLIGGPRSTSNLHQVGWGLGVKARASIGKCPMLFGPRGGGRSHPRGLRYPRGVCVLTTLLFHKKKWLCRSTRIRTTRTPGTRWLLGARSGC